MGADSSPGTKPMWKRWWFWVAVVLVIGAVGSLPDGDDQVTTPSSSSAVDADTRPTASASRALSVPVELLDAIASGEESGVGMEPIRGIAVKSGDFSNVYMVAMEFSATGIKNQVGVWATNSLSAGGGIIMAVDGTAKAFTVWPDADQTDAQITISDDGVAEAKAALQGQ